MLVPQDTNIHRQNQPKRVCSCFIDQIILLLVLYYSPTNHTHSHTSRSSVSTPPGISTGVVGILDRARRLLRLFTPMLADAAVVAAAGLVEY